MAAAKRETRAAPATRSVRPLVRPSCRETTTALTPAWSIQSKGPSCGARSPATRCRGACRCRLWRPRRRAALGPSRGLRVAMFGVMTFMLIAVISVIVVTLFAVVFLSRKSQDVVMRRLHPDRPPQAMLPFQLPPKHQASSCPTQFYINTQRFFFVVAEVAR
ncbi:hypothetical protein MRX96_003382 [Rhipicephalus microplus]